MLDKSYVLEIKAFGQKGQHNFSRSFGQPHCAKASFKFLLALKSFIKVSKFWNQIFLYWFEPKDERNYFLISALAFKMGQIKKMKALYFIN